MHCPQLVPLGTLMTIQAGYPFRGTVEPHAAADAVLALQMKDVTPDSGVHGGVQWAGAVRTRLGGRKPPLWLRAGDVLVLARGSRFFAVCLEEPPALAVCGPVFFQLRLRRAAEVDPAFLAWQINRPPCQRQLLQSAEGSAQRSIRRPLLECLMVAVPPLVQQQAVVALAALAQQERQALQRLIQLRAQEAEALAEDLHRAATGARSAALCG